MIWPTKNVYPGGKVPSYAKFGARGGRHTGLDFGRYGQPVVAAEGGKVRWVGDMKAGGWAVWISHPNGLETRYMHLMPGSIQVKRGQAVARGQQIAQVGHSGLERVPRYVGKLKQVAHLHFEVRKDGKAMDPETYLGAGSAVLVLLAAGALVLITAYGG